MEQIVLFFERQKGEQLSYLSISASQPSKVSDDSNFTMKWITVALMITVIPAVSSAVGLKYGFYDNTCPLAEEIVRQAVASAFAKDPGVAAGLIRMHFHDCFVRGCDASVLLNSSKGDAERDARPNLTLRPSAFAVIDEAKEILERDCPDTVSCADILTFAARDSASLAGNICYRVPAGRRDGFISNISEVSLPSPFEDAAALIKRFKEKNLTPDDLVTLSGAHSIGIAHCGTFRNRIFLNTSSQIDPSLSVSYGELLEAKCTRTPSPTTTVRLDLITADVLDNKYYVGVQNNLGLFTSDHALTTLPQLNNAVNENAKSADVWVKKFKRASVKMGEIEVLTGDQGEIRKKCSAVNARVSLAVE